jgi:hypothetical protein
MSIPDQTRGTEKITTESNLSLTPTNLLMEGLIVYILFFHPFLTYSQRNRVGVNWLAFALGAFVAGSLVGILARAHPFLASICMIGAICVVHVVRIIVDLSSDPTTHNLFPFEFALILFSGALPALAGAAIGKLFN